MIIGLKKKLDRAGGRWMDVVSSIQMVFGCLDFFLTLQHPLTWVEI